VWPVVELTTCWSQVRWPNHYATRPPLCMCMCVFPGHANEGNGGHTALTVSSTTPSSSNSSILQLIQSVATQILQQCVNSGVQLDIPVSTYASILADTFYDQQQNQSAGGTVALTDSTLSELSTFVRRNLELRRRRTSLWIKSSVIEGLLLILYWVFFSTAAKLLCLWLKHLDLFSNSHSSVVRINEEHCHLC